MLDLLLRRNRGHARRLRVGLSLPLRPHRAPSLSARLGCRFEGAEPKERHRESAVSAVQGRYQSCPAPEHGRRDYARF